MTNQVNNSNQRESEHCDHCDLPIRVTRLEQTVYGDEHIGLMGMKKTMENIDTKMSLLLGERDRLKNIVIGMLIIVGIGGATSIATFVRVLGLVTGVPTP